MMLFCNFSGLLAARDVLDKSALYSGSPFLVVSAVCAACGGTDRTHHQILANCRRQ